MKQNVYHYCVNKTRKGVNSLIYPSISTKCTASSCVLIYATLFHVKMKQSSCNWCWWVFSLPPFMITHLPSSSVFDYYPISSCLSVITDLALSLAGFIESLVYPRQEDSIIFQQVIWKFVLVFNSIRKHSESCIHNLGKSQFAFPRCWIPLMYFLSLSAIHSISLKLPVDLEIVHCTWCSLSVSHPLTWDVLSDLELAWIHTTHTYIHAHVHTHTPLLTSEVDDHPWEVIIKDLMLG